MTVYYDVSWYVPDSDTEESKNAADLRAVKYTPPPQRYSTIEYYRNSIRPKSFLYARVPDPTLCQQFRPNRREVEESRKNLKSPYVPPTSSDPKKKSPSYYVVMENVFPELYRENTTPAQETASYAPIPPRAAPTPSVKSVKKKLNFATPPWTSLTPENYQNNVAASSSKMGRSEKPPLMDCSNASYYNKDNFVADLQDISSSSKGKENISPDDSPSCSPSLLIRSPRRRRRQALDEEPLIAEVKPLPRKCEILILPKPLQIFIDLNMSEVDLAGVLSGLSLNEYELQLLGYPVVSPKHPSCALIYAIDFYSRRNFDNQVPTNANPMEDDSGQGSGSSSPRSPDSDPDNEEERSKLTVERRCARCSRGFFLTGNGEYVTRERCRHHWGRLQPASMSESQPLVMIWKWSCCDGSTRASGCVRAPLHVWSGKSAGMNGPLPGYVQTGARTAWRPCREVLALDCEMCFSASGLQIARIVVIAADGTMVYSAYVLPDEPIIDYNTRYSGISEADINSATKTLKDVQNDLLELIDAQTVLIGHGLENDLRALRIIHSSIVDTAVCFPHERGLPYRQSLKALAQQYLGHEFQQSNHCPLEDARVALELVLLKVRNDFINNSVS